MKKIYLLILAILALFILTGCGGYSGEQATYTEGYNTVEFSKGLYKRDSIIELQLAMYDLTEQPDTIVVVKPKVDTSKEELSKKEKRFEQEIKNSQRQEEINKNLDLLQLQQIKLDSLLKNKKEMDINGGQTAAN